ncbi:bifunctional UDP-N-acetylglucosamine diphosphorylase/glucosamine-1-phosphate N-acetyltransferase GlmU [Gilvimarinus sp. F26214L]|uniref:bifunctional UDP-N-acetylglucosamine diphosphorylase/glucosamine-1-phosphate N-acetyltransferase GlmU n=1 Tax=Gilvimarinus sp. DZF01 TaxID=3461371 RepID=UPI0040468458
MLNVVVLAAGKGTRMKSRLPKVLHPVGGRPLLQHVLDTARQLEIRPPINTIIGHGAEQIEAALTAPEVRFVLQAEQLGTGHAVQQALPYVQAEDTVLILYGDVPLTRAATIQRLTRCVSEDSLGLLTLHLEDPAGYGRIVRDEQGRVVAIVEQKDASTEQKSINEVNTGILAVRGAHLQRWLPELSNDNAQGEYYLTDIIALASRDGVRVNTEQPEKEWEVLGINNRAQQAELERIFQQEQARQFMADGLSLMDPARFDCRGALSFGEDVVIDVNCVLEGTVELGNNVRIGPNCCLRNARIGDNSVIKANTIVEDAQLGESCEAGPFARLRPGAELRNGAKVGNFVEIKKALLGEGSKVNHLSYIGDAKIGKKVNVGAGTITCNYDGVNKSLTEIGDDAFIGSNTALVAPVKVGRGATIGAGSTISNDVPDEQLSVARGRQRNIEGWERPKKR